MSLEIKRQSVDQIFSQDEPRRSSMPTELSVNGLDSQARDIDWDNSLFDHNNMQTFNSKAKVKKQRDNRQNQSLDYISAKKLINPTLELKPIPKEYIHRESIQQDRDKEVFFPKLNLSVNANHIRSLQNIVDTERKAANRARFLEKQAERAQTRITMIEQKLLERAEIVKSKEEDNLRLALLKRQ